MNAYRLYELNDEEFEKLTIQICIQILGTGTFSFAIGKDGGRDGRFNGTAQRYLTQLSRSLLRNAANVTLCFQQLARCSSRNPFLFTLLHRCPGVYGYPPSSSYDNVEDLIEALEGTT